MKIKIKDHGEIIVNSEIIKAVTYQVAISKSVTLLWFIGSVSDGTQKQFYLNNCIFV